jgi:hypothetical protein
MLVACLSVIESMTFMTAAAPMHGDLVSSLLDFLDAINRYVRDRRYSQSWRRSCIYTDYEETGSI